MSTEKNIPDSGVASVTPEKYIHDQLDKARTTLKRTKIAGSVLLLVLGGETVLVAGKFAYSLQPREAATIVSGLVSDQIDKHSDELTDSIAERVPAMIQQSPDYVIGALPSYRSALESKVDSTLVHYTQSTSAALGTHIDDYIASNKTQIQAVLDSGESPAAVASLGPGLRAALTAYMNEKPADGSASITDQVNESLASIKEVQNKVHHLATDDNLSPTDRQTRHALAVIAASVSKQNLQPIPIKEAVPQPTQLVASAE